MLDKLIFGSRRLKASVFGFIIKTMILILLFAAIFPEVAYSLATAALNAHVAAIPGAVAILDVIGLLFAVIIVLYIINKTRG